MKIDSVINGVYVKAYRRTGDENFIEICHFRLKIYHLFLVYSAIMRLLISMISYYQVSVKKILANGKLTCD